MLGHLIGPGACIREVEEGPDCSIWVLQDRSGGKSVHCARRVKGLTPIRVTPAPKAGIVRPCDPTNPCAPFWR